MSKDIMIDIETADKESTAIVLSLAAIHFDLEEDVKNAVSYNQLLERAIYVKFNSMEQANLGRTAGKETLKWWMNQDENVRNFAIKRSEFDLPMNKGLTNFFSYVNMVSDKNTHYWARGVLDPLCLESLCKTAGVDPLHYNKWLDVRTALRCLKSTTNRIGYCEVLNFDEKTLVRKHHPVHDCAYDIMMLLYGE